MSTHSALVSLNDFLQIPFDYIVVGGGTAGLVLAARLTENPDITVGILEAGKLRLGDEIVDSMGGNQQMLHNPEYDWTFKTIPQRHSANRVIHVARGKMLGGSSGLNFMAYVRPSVEDIDSWASQAPGWSWDVLQPYYRKSEALLPDASSDTRPEYFALDPGFHGQSGPILTSWPPSPSVIDPAMVMAMGDVAVPSQNKDPYQGHHLGFAQYLSTVDRRNKQVSRSYAATGYLGPCLDRPNLHILTESTACQITLDMAVNRAVGVRFLYGSNEHEVTAKCEVIISAGSIQSPRLLELSGIGNPEILRAAGVHCLIDLPEVGENLQDHPMSAVTYELTKSPEHVTLDSVLTDPDVFREHLNRLVETQDGLLAGATGLIGFLPYASQVPEERMQATLATITASQPQLSSAYRREQSERMIRLLQDPEASAIEVVGMPCHFDIAAGGANQSQLITGPPPGTNDCYTLLVSPMYVMSRGSTHIKAPMAEGVDLRTEAPEIDLAFLSHQAEVDVLAAGITIADRAFRSRHLAGRTLRRVVPPAEVDLEDVTQACEYVRGNVMVFNHSLGTCAMGRVVDERLRVRGVANLRIVDCSVIPDQISANPVATVYALAERAADLIQEDGRRG